MGNAGSDYGRLRTAIKTGSYRMACEIARGLPRLDLKDALTLTLMSFTKDPPHYPRLARRWLSKFMEELTPNMEQVAYAAELLRDLSPGHEQAVLEAIAPMLG